MIWDVYPIFLTPNKIFKVLLLSYWKYDLGCLSRVLIFQSWITDLGFKKALDPGSWIRVRHTAKN
jgi:hypothetical protein